MGADLGHNPGSILRNEPEAAGSLNRDSITIAGHGPSFSKRESAGAVKVLLGNGDGSFQVAGTVAARISGSPVVVGDFNNDGILDVAMVDHRSGTVRVWLGTTNGIFQPSSSFVAGGCLMSVRVGDFNGDGNLDLAVTVTSREPTLPRRSRQLRELSTSVPVGDQVEAKKARPNQTTIPGILETAAEEKTMATVTVAREKGESHATARGREIGEDGTSEIGLPPLPAAVAPNAEPAVLEQLDDSPHDLGPVVSSPVGHLLVGQLPIDLAGLGRKVDAFFSRVEKLGDEVTDAVVGSRLTPWLVTGTVTAAAYALAWRYLRPPTLNGGGTGDDGRNHEWTWFSDSAVVPPWDKL
jgi:hypothetical protein